MAEHLLDTNVLSKIFYGNVDVKKFVDNLDVGIETIVYIECVQGSISNSDKKRIKRTLQRLKFYSLNDDIAQKAISSRSQLCLPISIRAFSHKQHKSICSNI